MLLNILRHFFASNFFLSIFLLQNLGESYGLKNTYLFDSRFPLAILMVTDILFLSKALSGEQGNEKTEKTEIDLWVNEAPPQQLVPTPLALVQ